MRTPQKSLSLLLLFLLPLLCMTLACNRAGQMFGSKDKGGSYLIIAVKADGAKLDQSIAQTIDVIEKRCDRLGIYCKLQRHGGDKSNQIMLRISSTLDPERVKSVLLSEGLELRPVVSPPMPAPFQRYSTQEEAAAAAGTNKEVLPYVEESPKSFVVLERTPIVTGQDIRRAEAMALSDEDYQVNFALNPEGAQRFGNWTGANINNYLAVVLNKEVRSVVYIKSQIFDSGQITGRFTKVQAEDAALVLMSGNLPAPIEALEEGTYKP